MNVVATSQKVPGQPDVEHGGAHSIAWAYEQRKRLVQMASNTIGGTMVIAALCCWLFGPEYNTAHHFLDLAQRALNIVYLVFNGVWLGSFIAFAVWGEWSKLHGFQQRCHRFMCIALVSAAIVLNKLAPNQIVLSYCPAALTLLVELTYLLIDITSTILACLGTGLVWLFGKLGVAVLAIWNKLCGWFSLGFAVRVGV